MDSRTKGHRGSRDNRSLGTEDSEAREIKLVRGELKGVNEREDMAFDGLQLSFWFISLGIALAHP